MRRSFALFAWFAVLLLCVAIAKDWWEKRPYTDWSDKEAVRMLDNSPWGRIHTVTIINQQYSGDTRTFQSIGGGDMEREKRNLFHLRFITAKPVKMAIARQLMLARKAAAEQLEKYINEPNNQSIVLAMTMSSDPPGASSLSGYNAALMKLRTTDLTSNTSLTTDTGRKVYLVRYDPPGPEGLGAKFYFPRNLPDGSALVAKEDKQIRFETALTLLENQQPAFQTGYESQRTDKIYLQFDLRKMVFEGKLEI